MLVVKQYVKKPIFDGKEQSFRNRKKQNCKTENKDGAVKN